MAAHRGHLAMAVQRAPTKTCAEGTKRRREQSQQTTTRKDDNRDQVVRRSRARAEAAAEASENALFQSLPSELAQALTSNLG